MFKVIPATIFPDGSKAPIISGWKEAASNDPAQIQEWMDKFGSTLNLWAIPTGETNDIIAIDIDVKDGKNGFETLKNLKLELPITLTQTTNTGGMHLIYRKPKGLILGNTVGMIGSGVDTRCENGMLWLYQLDNVPMADAPEWLLSIAPKQDNEIIEANYKIESEYANHLLNDICQKVLDAPNGERNNTLNACAYEAAQVLINTGSLSRVDVSNALLKASTALGLPEFEGKTTITSGIDAGLKAGVRHDCPFDPTIPPNEVVVYDEARWTPKKMTREQMHDWTKLTSPVIYRHWSVINIQLLTADGGTGKTTLLLNEAICTALGRPFLGFPCEMKGKTFYIIGEDDESRIISLIGKICAQMKLTDEEEDIVADSIYVKRDLDMILISKDRDGNFHPNANAMNKFTQAIEDVKPIKIVIDPIASFWGSESNLNDMGKAVMKFALLVKERYGTCVELVNHMGKSSSQSKDPTQFSGRGGSALPSHARVVKSMIGLTDEEFLEKSGLALDGEDKGILIHVSKFTDNSPLLKKPLLARRSGYCFFPVDEVVQVQEEKKTDVEIIYNIIDSYRSKNQFPTKNIVMAEALLKMSKDKFNMALSVLAFSGEKGRRISYIDNPNKTSKEKTIVFIDSEGKEI
jgi:RecA-family ATPase